MNYIQTIAQASAGEGFAAYLVIEDALGTRHVRVASLDSINRNPKRGAIALELSATLAENELPDTQLSRVFLSAHQDGSNPVLIGSVGIGEQGGILVKRLGGALTVSVSLYLEVEFVGASAGVFPSDLNPLADCFLGLDSFAGAAFSIAPYSCSDDLETTLSKAKTLLVYPTLMGIRLVAAGLFTGSDGMVVFLNNKPILHLPSVKSGVTKIITANAYNCGAMTVGGPETTVTRLEKNGTVFENFTVHKQPCGSGELVDLGVRTGSDVLLLTEPSGKFFALASPSEIKLFDAFSHKLLKITRNLLRFEANPLDKNKLWLMSNGVLAFLAPTLTLVDKFGKTLPLALPSEYGAIICTNATDSQGGAGGSEGGAGGGAGAGAGGAGASAGSGAVMDGTGSGANASGAEYSRAGGLGDEFYACLVHGGYLMKYRIFGGEASLIGVRKVGPTAQVARLGDKIAVMDGLEMEVANLRRRDSKVEETLALFVITFGGEAELWDGVISLKSATSVKVLDPQIMSFVTLLPDEILRLSGCGIVLVERNNKLISHALQFPSALLKPVAQYNLDNGETTAGSGSGSGSGSGGGGAGGTAGGAAGEGGSGAGGAAGGASDPVISTVARCGEQLIAVGGGRLYAAKLAVDATYVYHEDIGGKMIDATIKEDTRDANTITLLIEL